MAAGDTMQGERTEAPQPFQPGAYWKAPDGVWRAVTPSGMYGDLNQHEVTEHDDGTITVSPSILVSTPGQSEHNWHGFLERGVWREV